MSDRESESPRRPAVFRMDDPAPANKAPEAAQTTGSAPRPPRRPTAVAEPVSVVGDADDVFIGGAEGADDWDIDALTPPPAEARARRRFSFAKLAAGAFGIVFSIALGLWVDQLVRALFERAPWLAWATLALVAVGVFALVVALLREIVGIYRLGAIQKLKQAVDAAARERAPGKARAAVGSLCTLLVKRPETASGRAVLGDLDDEIIDGPALIDLAESELFGSLDREARRLILASSKRVSVVTAVSPRAVVDVAYVAYEATRLVRAMATLYGGRPGTFGMIRLMRDVIAHLAVTGSIAVGESLVQQIIGHGVAARLSSRLGEGVINGLMTARVGIAAMDLCRPMPFRVLRRPGAGEFLGDLVRTTGAGKSRAGRPKS